MKNPSSGVIRNFNFAVVFLLMKCYDMRVRSNMTWSGLVCGAMVLGGGGLCSAVEAIAPPEPAAPAGEAPNAFPYAVIVERNAFGLNPAPPPTAPPAALAPDLPKVIFSGTRQKGSQVWAMFAVKTTDAKKQETTTYMSLTNGEALGPVELVRISPNGDEVEIMNSGTRVVLNMKDNGFEKTSPAAPVAPALPGFRQLPGGVQMPGASAQPGATPTAYDSGPGINLGRTAISPIRGNINVQGAGPPAGAGPVNPAALVQPVVNNPVVSLGANTGVSGIKTSGPATPANNPVAANPFNAPMGGGTPPNSTPPPTITTRIAPPIPPMPGQ
jgi:hypothetical protein